MTNSSLGQKQPPGVLCKKMRYNKFSTIPEKTHVPECLLKRDLGTGIFLWILRNFLEYLFYRTPFGDYFYMPQLFTPWLPFLKVRLGRWRKRPSVGQDFKSTQASCSRYRRENNGKSAKLLLASCLFWTLCNFEKRGQIFRKLKFRWHNSV